MAEEKPSARTVVNRQARLRYRVRAAWPPQALVLPGTWTKTVPASTEPYRIH